MRTAQIWSCARASSTTTTTIRRRGIQDWPLRSMTGARSRVLVYPLVQQLLPGVAAAECSAVAEGWGAVVSARVMPGADVVIMEKGGARWGEWG